MPKAAMKVRELFQDHQHPLTLTDIKTFSPELKASEISMALCYLMKQRYLSRQELDSTTRGRRKVWQYSYHSERLPKETV